MSNTTSKKTGSNPYADWIQERFYSDANVMLDHFSGEAHDTFKPLGIDLKRTLTGIQVSSFEQKISKKLCVLTGGDKGSIGLWAKTKTINGIEYPYLNATLKGGKMNAVFNGYELVRELYEQEKDIKISESERAKREQKAKAKKAKQDAERAKIEAELKAEIEAKERSVKKDLEQHPTFGAAAATHKYAKNKRISESVLSATFDIRMSEDKHGKFLSLPLYNIHRQMLGIQKIYEQAFRRTPTSKPTNKTFTWGMTTDGAFSQIGDVWAALEEGKRVAICEGYATGASWFGATRQPTIVALNSGNLLKTLRDFVNWFPDAQFDIAADNDYWKWLEGKGNAGIKSALSALKEHGEKVKAYFPNWEKSEGVDLGDKPTDWNDVHLSHIRGLKGIRSMISRKVHRLEASNKPFEYSLQKLSTASDNEINNSVKAAVFSGMSLFPHMITGREVGERVVAAMAPALQNKKIKQQISQQIEWIFDSKISQARKLNGFDPERLKQSHINHHTFKPVRRGKGWYEMPDNVLRMVRNLDGIVIVKAPMGSGKTQKLMRPLMHEADKAAYIAHRVSLVAAACEKLSDKDKNIEVANYQNLTREMVPYFRHMGTCINSAPHPKFSDFFNYCDLICLDEAKQTLSHITDGTIDNPVQVFEFLQQIMSTTRQVVMCDADANDALLEFCEMACPGRTIHVLEVETDCSDFSVNYGSAEQVYQSVIDAARAGERCLVATDGAASGEDLAADIRMQIPDCRVLMIQRDSSGDQDVEAFQANPDAESHKYDVVIYSPSISSGVSIENNYFTRHYGIFYGVVSPTDATQMLRRDRYATHFTVGFKRIDSKKETDKQLIILGKMLANQLMAGEDELKTRWHNFDFTWASFAASERKASNDFANNMLLMLMANGYKVDRLETSPVMEEQARYSKKHARQICEAEKVDLGMKLTTPTDEEAKELSLKESISRSDNARLIRYMIETELQVPVTPDTIRFVNDRGVSKLKRLERALSSDDKAKHYDETLIKKDVVVTRRANVSASKAIWNKVLKHTGLNLETAEGDFSAAQAQAAMDAVLTDTNSIALYNELNIGPYVNPNAKPADATKWVKAIFDRFNITLKVKQVGKRKLRRHYICPDQHAFMMQFINNRKQAEINCLSITLTTDEEYAIATRYDTTAQPANPQTMGAGVCSAGGGAGCSVMDINREKTPVTGNITASDASVGVDLKGANVDGVLNDLVRVAIDLDIPLPETGGDSQLFLILLTVELQNRLAADKTLLDGYPEINWINWKGVA